jgi:hypothetical protein
MSTSNCVVPHISAIVSVLSSTVVCVLRAGGQTRDAMLQGLRVEGGGMLLYYCILL